MSAPERRAMIEIKNLTKEYVQGRSRIAALKDVPLTLREGMTAIVGTSGAGKSTLLHVLSGMEPFERGSVTIDHVSIAGLSEKEMAGFRNRNIGMVMQQYSLIPDFSVLENVWLPLTFSEKRCRKNERLELAKQAVRTVGIEELTKRPVDTLSGGQMQRVAIARAIVNSPRYLFADEPTGALDGENTEKILEVFRKIAEGGVCVLIVTHDMHVAECCRRIVRLEDGQIVSNREAAR